MAKKKYESNVLPKLTLVEAWARDGLSDEQISHNLGVAYSTFRRYKDMHEALSAALARGKEVVDVEVENDLLKKCHGYNAKIIKHYRVKITEYDTSTGKKISEHEELREAEDEVHVPSDITAIMFWLSNRMGKKWSYKPEEREKKENSEGGVVLLPDVEKIPEAKSE